MSSFREIINRWLESGDREGREEVDKAVRDNEEAARYLAEQLAIEEALEEMADEARMRRWEQAHRGQVRRRRWWLGGAGVLGLLFLVGAALMLNAPPEG
ncbi:MAG: hypothetical protein KDD10_30100, partial [Phaeodactylibacter sp.]|nr:hypothetical protein [Phaeodactylibacter sp.]